MVHIIIDLDPDDYTPMKNKQNLYVVIHYTGNKTDSARNNAKYFNNGKRHASAHYFVDSTEIVQIVRDSDASWGVGKKYGNARLWGKCTNTNSINIEMCSTNGKIDYATMKNTADLVRSLMARYNIPIHNVVRHYDVCAKRCPGWDGWLPNNESEWNRLIAMIQNTAPTSAEERHLVPVPQPSGVSGVLYKVTKDIAKDDALTVGTNIELDTVASELSSISERPSDDIDRVTQDGVVLTSPYTCTRKRECIRVEVVVGYTEGKTSGGQIFVNGHLAVKHTTTYGAGTYSVQTLIYLYEGDVLTFSRIGSGLANAWRVSDN